MEFILEYWRAGIEILILWIGLYQLYRVFRSTKGALIFIGVVIAVFWPEKERQASKN